MCILCHDCVLAKQFILFSFSIFFLLFLRCNKNIFQWRTLCLQWISQSVILEEVQKGIMCVCGLWAYCIWECLRTCICLLCSHVKAGASTYVCTCMWRQDASIYTLIILHLILLRQGLSLNLQLTNSTRLQACLHTRHPSAGITDVWCRDWLFRGHWRSDSGPHACTIGTLSTELLPWPTALGSPLRMLHCS